MNNNSLVQPGFCIAQQPGTLASQAAYLFHDKNREAASLFMQLNADTQWVKPGQMLIVADPKNSTQDSILAELKKAKRKVDRALVNLDTATASFMNKHYEEIASLTSTLDKITGNVSGAGEAYFSKISEKLQSIERLYQTQFATHGSLVSPQFFSERKRMFLDLERHLNSLVKRTLKFHPYNEIKHALNLSSKSIAHEWKAAGIGSIEGYSTYVGRASSIAKHLKMGGWISIGFSGLNSTNKVYHSCTTGRESECKKVAVKEYTRFGVSTGTSYLGGSLGAAVGGGICVAAGVATGGAAFLACSILGAAGGGYVGGELGGKASDKIMDKIL